ncbi:MAG: hypothetical protein J6Z04_05885 [Clostridia bacterium]|nr:hypothetical protein [Clostridia bacterium]
MYYCFGTLAKILVGVLSIISHIINLFGSNIIVIEVTEGISFNYQALLKSKMFWIMLVITAVYYLAALCFNRSSNAIDESIAQALNIGSIVLLSNAITSAQQNDFISSKKFLKMFDQFQKRGGKVCQPKSKSRKKRRKK